MMHDAEIKFVLETLGSSVCRAVDEYTTLSGEFADTMPESVMCLGGLYGLRAKKVSVMLEANAEMIHDRFANSISGQEADLLESAMSRLKNGRVDLVVLWGDGEPRHRRPVGFIEFKRWQYREFDAARVADLLANVPGARFGACIILKDMPPSDTWIQTLRDKLGDSADVSARDVSSVTKRNHPCQVVCCTQLRRV